MFLSSYPVSDGRLKTFYLGIINLNGKKATQIMNTLKLFFETTQTIHERVLFSLLDGTNAMSGKEGGLRRI